MITCTDSNLADFRAALRAQPDIHAFAAALHRAGMLPGLRGARLAPLPGGLPAHPGAVVPVTSLAAEARIADRDWQIQQRTQEARHV